MSDDVQAPPRPAGWRFSFGDADAAACELELTAQSLLEAVALFEHDVPIVTDGWAGRFRAVFDVESLRFDGAARLLADDLVVLAASVRAKSIEAAAAWTP